MSYTPVIPTPPNTQTNRANLMAALVALIDAFIASESYTCGRVYKSAMPDSLVGEGPMIVLGDVQEAVVHDWQTRTTTFSGNLYYVDWVTSPEETADRVDRWADFMRDLFTANKSLLTDGVLEQQGFQEGELAQGTLVFAAPSIQFTYVIQEGRA